MSDLNAVKDFQTHHGQGIPDFFKQTIFGFIDFSIDLVSLSL